MDDSEDDPLNHCIRPNDSAVNALEEERQTELLNQLSAWYARVEAFHATTLQNIESWAASSLPVRLDILQSHWAKAQNLQEALVLTCSNEDDVAVMLAETQERAIICYGEAKYMIEAKIFEYRGAARAKRNPKASEVSVVKFYGDYASWPAWRAQFVAKVYETPLDVHEKLELLSRSLRDQAAACVGPIINRDTAELDRAWSTLTKRYDNEYQLAISHLNEILNIKLAREDIPKDLRGIIDTINQELRLLQRFDFDTDAWSPLIVAIILRRLDALTLREWERLENRQHMPKLDDLLAFIERRVAAITNWHDLPARTRKESARGDHGRDARVRPYDKRDRRHERSRSERPRSPPRAANSNGGPDSGGSHSKSQEPARPPHGQPCPSCKSTHRLWNCRSFKEKALEEQIKDIEKWRLCPNCLVDRHPSAECPRFGCQMCDFAKHNSLICPKRAVKRVHHARGKKRNGSNPPGAGKSA